MKKIPSKSLYDEQSKKLLAKGKKIQSYDDLTNFSLLFILCIYTCGYTGFYTSNKNKKEFSW